jgi:hypothetical protein
MTLVGCCVFLPFFHSKYTISFPDSSSSQASKLTIWSSQEPAGGFHVCALTLAGGSESDGWSPFLLDLLMLACGVDDDGRPLFFPFTAFAVSV